ncbi:ACP phosphodiesterase, partial [Salmonella enterica subsp. enterica serovar Kentucky]|nr:ACP phosphodiesterase [Salmonella enterica subsp. enterica serovar Kentucky]
PGVLPVHVPGPGPAQIQADAFYLCAQGTGNSCLLTVVISVPVALQAFVGYAHAQVATILPDSPPRFVNLNDYLWSEKWLERYRD